jgi:SSS family solute:Na+ symporter
MAQNFWLSLIAWTACFVITIVVSLITRPKPVHELKNLVWGATEMPKETGEKSWYQKPMTLAVIVAIICVILNIWYR